LKRNECYGDSLEDYPEYDEFIRKLNFNLREQEIIRELKIQPDSFLPLLFSLKFGGNWSIKTKNDSLNVIAIKDKLTRYNPEKMTGSTLETIYLISNPIILKKEGHIYRLEKCSQDKERKVVKRPFKVHVNGENIIKAVLDPKTLEITLKRVKGPLSFEGSTAFGLSHEMDHISGSEKSVGKCLWDFSYKLHKN
jgi:predicted metalloprotease